MIDKAQRMTFSLPFLFKDRATINEAGFRSRKVQRIRACS